MTNKDAFSSYHPGVNFLYFALVLAFTMFVTSPAVIVLSALCALVYAVSLKGGRAAWSGLMYLLPLGGMAAVVNTLFNHRGATVLAYLPSGNPLTLESVLYGLSAAGMLCAVLLWFSCYTEVMTSDKFVYLFGRVIPALSLVLSMTLRFVPRFRAQLRAVADAQRCVGRDVGKGTVRQRLRRGVAMVSILVTWAMENAIETADSMKARGYGLPGRAAFSVYLWEARDGALSLWLGSCGAYLVYGWASGALDWRWYPTSSGAPVTPFTATFPLVFLALCLTPVFLDRREDAMWKRLRSEI